MTHRTRAIGALVTAFAMAIGASGPALADHKPASSIPAQALVEPADFAASLAAPTQPKPLMLQVGFRKAYAQAHIPGSEYVGAGSDEEGLGALRQRVAKLPKDSAIVIYCGCCPWKKCPNIAAAYDALQQLGFKNVKVIHINEDFGTDWADKGFPTATDL
jgi:rhodanese-related sulfurtransferase